MISLFFKFPNFQLAADPDPNVKNGAELLDRLIKVSAHWLIIFIIIIITIFIIQAECTKPNVVCISQEKSKKLYLLYLQHIYSKLNGCIIKLILFF